MTARSELVRKFLTELRVAAKNKETYEGEHSGPLFHDERHSIASHPAKRQTIRAYSMLFTLQSCSNNGKAKSLNGTEKSWPHA